MQLTSLTSLSPLDGRYHKETTDLRDIFSEFALIKERVYIELKWFMFLAGTEELHELPALDTKSTEILSQIHQNFSVTQAEEIKKIEKSTNHDLKAVEYFLREQFAKHTTLKSHIEFIHFACTSEDINNLAYARMLKRARNKVLIPVLNALILVLTEFAHQSATQPMLSRTHGQPASPTTVGKEIANIVYRLQRQMNKLKQTAIMGKVNGAVGNFNAHRIAYPQLDWPQLSRQFVESLRLKHNPYTIQIEPHDSYIEMLNIVAHINTILKDLSRDMWSYISAGYFKQKIASTEVGSSTMPHKTNPIDFENAEGNLGLANSMINFLSNQLPTSRWQRDLVDSTLLRNLGVVLGHCKLAYTGILKGFNKLEMNVSKLNAELEAHPEVITEAIQTVMRSLGFPDSYEKIKQISQGQALSLLILHEYIEQTTLPSHVKKRLKQLTPSNYLGYAVEFANNI